MTLNLSCGKCKVIQPFSGVPPTCEVCGWVCSTTNMRAVTRSKRTDNSNYEPRNTGSGGGLFILLLILGVLVFAWSRLSSEPSDNNQAARAESSEASLRECVEPENPYSEGTGHYAGYEWAERNGSSCSSSSQSFNEGCEEYATQESEYEECEAENKK
jgi:hypothetical protein